MVKKRTARKGATLDKFTSFAAAFDAIGGDIIGAVGDAMIQSATNLRDELRDQTRRAGLGRGLEKAWRLTLYPKDMRAYSPAALVHSSAPLIHDAYNYGGIVTAHNAKYLAIPTKYVPGKLAMQTNSLRKNGPETKSLPALVEQWFGRKLEFVKGKNGANDRLVMPAAVMAKSGRGYKAATKRRVKGNKAEVLSLPMFTLVKQVTHVKKLDLEGAFSAAGNEFARLLNS